MKLPRHWTRVAFAVAIAASAALLPAGALAGKDRRIDSEPWEPLRFGDPEVPPGGMPQYAGYEIYWKNLWQGMLVAIRPTRPTPRLSAPNQTLKLGSKPVRR